MNILSRWRQSGLRMSVHEPAVDLASRTWVPGIRPLKLAKMGWC